MKNSPISRWTVALHQPIMVSCVQSTRPPVSAARATIIRTSSHLDLLVEMLEHPDRYEWARVEADDAGSLDDVVALRVDGVIVARQVKFSAHPNDAADPYSWYVLLKERTSEKGKTLPSLLSKWGTSFRELK